MGKQRAEDNEIQRELNRRLELVLDDNYGDPARTDISRWEIVLWFAFAFATAAVTAALRQGV